MSNFIRFAGLTPLDSLCDKHSVDRALGGPESDGSRLEVRCVSKNEGMSIFIVRKRKLQESEGERKAVEWLQAFVIQSVTSSMESARNIVDQVGKKEFPSF